MQFITQLYNLLFIVSW